MSDDLNGKSRVDELVASVEANVQDFRQGITQQTETDVERLLERVIALELKVANLEKRLAGQDPPPHVVPEGNAMLDNPVVAKN
jgi:hypothetical protein